MSQRQLHLNTFIHDIGHHEAAWRLPESDPLASTDVGHYIRIAQIAEAAKFDSIFFADGPVLFGDPAYRPAGVLEPLTLLAADHPRQRAADAEPVLRHRPDRRGSRQAAARSPGRG